MSELNKSELFFAGYYWKQLCLVYIPVLLIVSNGVNKICTGDPRTCTIFIQAWGSNWGSSGFSCNQNNQSYVLLGAYVTSTAVWR